MVEFVLILATLVLLFIIRKPLRQALTEGLDGRANRIRAEMDEARRLHDEARALFERHRSKLAEGEKAAAEIVSHAEDEARRLEERLKTEMEHTLKRREEMALERIAQEEAKAVRDVRVRVADLAVRTTRQLLTERIGGGGADDVMKNAIAEVKQKLA